MSLPSLFYCSPIDGQLTLDFLLFKNISAINILRIMCNITGIYIFMMVHECNCTYICIIVHTCEYKYIYTIKS